jgi:dTDP-4-dehydrorhamnose 3,5-epimerase
MYNDPELALSWPLPVSVISAKDQGWKPMAEIESDLKTRMAVK